jgi:hypothetical protein
VIKTEQRIRDFSSGIKKLGDDNREYILKLTHDLFLIEKLTACSVLVKKDTATKAKKRTRAESIC